MGISKYHRAGKVADKFIEKESPDIRDSKMFKQFMDEVLQFVREENAVTWRQLAERFYYDHYHIGLAIEQLDGKKIVVEKEKIPEIIRMKKK